MCQVKEWVAERCGTHLAGAVELSWRNGRVEPTVAKYRSGVELCLAVMELNGVEKRRVVAKVLNGVEKRRAVAKVLSGVEKRRVVMELNGVEKHLAVMELSGAKTRQVSAAAVATLVLEQEALPASADLQQAAGCPVLAHDLSDAVLYLPGFVGDCCGDECAESWMMVRLFLHLHLLHRVRVRKQVERPQCHPLYIPYRRHPLGYREHLEFRAH
jgi:hypothetical protein